jgi:bacterioferritin
MKGDPKVIEHLNKILKNELTAINQYFLHSRMLKDWGLEKLADKEFEESVDEMKHADAADAAHPVPRGPAEPAGPRQADDRRERQGNPRVRPEARAHALPDLKDAIAYCESIGDYVSRHLFREILSSEEEHVDWLETQLGLIEKMGLENLRPVAVLLNTRGRAAETGRVAAKGGPFERSGRSPSGRPLPAGTKPAQPPPPIHISIVPPPRLCLSRLRASLFFLSAGP